MLLSLRNFSASSQRMQPIRSNQTKVRVNRSKQTQLNMNGWLEKSSVKHRKRERRRGGAEKFCILCARRTNWTSLTLSLCLDLSEEALTAHESSITLFHVVVAILLSLRQTEAALFLESVLHRPTTLTWGTQRCLTCVGWD